MKSRIPTYYQRFTQKQKSELKEYFEQIIVNTYTEDCRAQRLRIIESCIIILHEYLHLPQDQLLLFMAAWRLWLPRDKKFIAEGRQEAEHKRLIEECLGKGDMVKDFFDLFQEKLETINILEEK